MLEQMQKIIDQDHKDSKFKQLKSIDKRIYNNLICAMIASGYPCTKEVVNENTAFLVIDIDGKVYKTPEFTAKNTFQNEYKLVEQIIVPDSMVEKTLDEVSNKVNTSLNKNNNNSEKKETPKANKSDSVNDKPASNSINDAIADILSEFENIPMHTESKKQETKSETHKSVSNPVNKDNTSDNKESKTDKINEQKESDNPINIPDIDLDAKPEKKEAKINGVPVSKISQLNNEKRPIFGGDAIVKKDDGSSILDNLDKQNKKQNVFLVSPTSLVKSLDKTENKTEEPNKSEDVKKTVDTVKEDTVKSNDKQESVNDTSIKENETVKEENPVTETTENKKSETVESKAEETENTEAAKNSEDTKEEQEEIIEIDTDVTTDEDNNEPEEIPLKENETYRHIHRVKLRKKYMPDSVTDEYVFTFWPLVIYDRCPYNAFFAEFMVLVQPPKGNPYFEVVQKKEHELFLTIDGLEFKVFCVWNNAHFESTVSLNGETNSIYELIGEDANSIEKHEPIEAISNSYLDQFRYERKGQAKHFAMPVEMENTDNGKAVIIGFVIDGKGNRIIIRPSQNHDLVYKANGSEKHLSGRWIGNGKFELTLKDEKRF